MRSSLVIDRSVWLRFVMARSGSDTAQGFIPRLHIHPLSLIIPIGSLVDSLHFRQSERNAAKAVWAFPLHLGRADHFVVLRTVLRRCGATQFNQLICEKFKCFAVLPVIVDECLFCREISGCLPSTPPDDCFKPRPWRA